MDLETILVRAESKGLKSDEFKRLLQDKYITLMREGRLNDVTALNELTGIAPVYHEEILQEVYARYLRESKYDEFKKLIGMSSVQPTEQVIQEAFETAIFTPQVDFWKVEQLMNVTESVPGNKIVQRAYLSFAEKEDYSSLIELKQITRIEPCDEVSKKVYSRDKLQTLRYRSMSPKNLMDMLLTRVDNDVLCELTEYINLTGVKPPCDDIQNTYLSIFKTGQLSFMSEFTQIVKTEPSQETIQAALEYLLSQREVQKFSNMLLALNINPDREIVQQAYRSYALGGYVGEIKELKNITGVEPDEKVTDALVEGLLADRRRNYTDSRGPR